MENEKRSARARKRPPDRYVRFKSDFVGRQVDCIDANKETLTITGEGLSVTEINLDSGRLSATGRVKEIRFSETLTKAGLIKKIFK